MDTRDLEDKVRMMSHERRILKIEFPLDSNFLMIFVNFLYGFIKKYLKAKA